MPCRCIWFCLEHDLQLLTVRVKRERLMNKFLQLAEDIEDDLRELDNDADALNERRLEIKERARVATNAHHSTYDTIESGLSRLEEAAAGMGGRKNSKDEKKPEEKPEGTAKNGEGSDVTSESFQGKTDG